MMKITRSRRIDTIFVLIIFGIFALSVLMVLAFGASIYKNINSIAREGQNERTVLSYVRSKVKNNDGAGTILTGDFHGLSSIFIYEEIGHTLYCTVIYRYDGWLYEIFSDDVMDFYPEEGIQITKIDRLTFETVDGGLIKVNAGDKSILLFPRGDQSPPGDYIFLDGMSSPFLSRFVLVV